MRFSSQIILVKANKNRGKGKPASPQTVTKTKTPKVPFTLQPLSMSVVMATARGVITVEAERLDNLGL